jgi:spore germination protein KC
MAAGGRGILSMTLPATEGKRRPTRAKPGEGGDRIRAKAGRLDVRRIRRHGAIMVTTLMLMVSLAGCWDNRALDARQLVLAMGVGPAPHGAVTVYLESPTPSGLTSGTAAGGAVGSSSGPDTYVIMGTGPDLGAAISDAQSQTDRDIYLGQTQLVVMSRRLSARQFTDAVNWLTRIGHFDKTAFVAEAGAPLHTILSYKPQADPLGPIYFMTLFTCARCQTVALHRTVWSMEVQSLTPGSSIWLPVIDSSGPNFVVRRMVAFRGDTPAAWLSQPETIAFGYLTARTSKATISVMTPDGLIGLRAVHASRRTDVTWADGRMTIAVHLQVVGAIDSAPTGAGGTRLVSGLEQKVSRSIATSTLKVMRLLQRRGADPEGFGRRLFWTHPTLLPQWEHWYRRAHLSVSVTTVINNVGDAS